MGERIEDIGGGELTLGNLAAGDLLPVLDISDTTDDPSGTTKYIAWQSMLGTGLVFAGAGGMTGTAGDLVLDTVTSGDVVLDPVSGLVRVSASDIRIDNSWNLNFYNAAASTDAASIAANASDHLVLVTWAASKPVILAPANSERFRADDTGALVTGEHRVQQTGNDAAGIADYVTLDSDATEINDAIAVTFRLHDDVTNDQDYARILGAILSPDNTDEEGYLRFDVAVAGSLAERFYVDKDGSRTTGVKTVAKTGLDGAGITELVKLDSDANDVADGISIGFYAHDSLSNDTEFARIEAEIVTSINGSERGKVTIGIAQAGTITDLLILDQDESRIVGGDLRVDEHGLFGDATHTIGTVASWDSQATQARQILGLYSDATAAYFYVEGSGQAAVNVVDSTGITNYKWGRFHSDAGVLTIDSLNDNGGANETMITWTIGTGVGTVHRGLMWKKNQLNPSGTGWNVDVDLELGNDWIVNLASTTGNGTIDFDVNALSSGELISGTVAIKQHGTTSRDITFAVVSASSPTIKWSGTEPTWSSMTAGEWMVIRYLWDDDLEILFLDPGSGETT